MKNKMYHFVAALLLLGACSDSKTEETAAPAAPVSDEGKALTKMENASKVGDYDQAKVWIALSKDRAHGGSARIEVLSNAENIPDSLKAGAIESVQLSIEMATKPKLSTTEAEKALELLK